MNISATELALAISVQGFSDQDVVESLKPMATYMLGAMASDEDQRKEFKAKLLEGLKDAQKQIPALIEKIGAL